MLGESWSAARRGGAAPPFRSAAKPGGLPKLGPEDRDKVDDSLKITHAAESFWLPFAPSFQPLLQRSSDADVRVRQHMLRYARLKLSSTVRGTHAKRSTSSSKPTRARSVIGSLCLFGRSCIKHLCKEARAKRLANEFYLSRLFAALCDVFQ